MEERGGALATLYYGFSRPAIELIGDIGTYSIGGLIAISAIIGGFEVAGANRVDSISPGSWPEG